jgi:hypothetical protein
MAFRRRSRFLALAFGVATLALSAGALAEPTPAERETARGLMTQGRNQRDGKDLKAALQSFTAADAIMKVPTTGLEVARTQEMLGMLVEARDTALRTLRIPEQPNEPAPFKEARAKAQAMSDDLETRIPSIKIALKGATDGTTPTVTVDGTALPAAALSMPYKLNPGHHVIEATTKGSAGKVEIDVAEKETKDVELALVAKAGGDTTVVAPPDKPIDEPPPPPPPPSGGGRTLTYAGFGLAGVGIAVGSITGLVSMSKKSDAQAGCKDNRCPPSTYNSIDSANTMATISTISFIAAGVGATVGIISLVLRSDPAPPPPTSGIRATPWIGLGSVGVNGSF